MLQGLHPSGLLARMDARNGVSAPIGIGKVPGPTADAHRQLGGRLCEMHRQDLLMAAREQEDAARSLGRVHFYT